MKKMLTFLNFAFCGFLYPNVDPIEGLQDITYPTEYVHPIDDDTVIPLPLIALRGKIQRYTFPGAPNYESIEKGDISETRWVLVIPEPEIQRLTELGFIPQEDVFTPEMRGWVQLISPCSEDDPIPFLNKQVVVEGYLGTLVVHVHTSIAMEAVGIYGD
jgi:hypothetical protein